MIEASAPKRKSVRKDDGTYWVISERRFLATTPLFVMKDRDAAYACLDGLGLKGPLLSRFRIDRVDLAV